uniref:Uncharacterized protein n=1 Tax=Salix viminalis TaxID=40686 RepID=A0A6N2M6U9_SALVM
MNLLNSAGYKILSQEDKEGLEGDGGCRLTTKEPAANVVLLDYISSKKWEEVVDFDDHLDDITKDWLNPELFK